MIDSATATVATCKLYYQMKNKRKIQLNKMQNRDVKVYAVILVEMESYTQVSPVVLRWSRRFALRKP